MLVTARPVAAHGSRAKGRFEAKVFAESPKTEKALRADLEGSPYGR